MSKLFKTEGVVLRRFNLGETDQLVTLLSKDRGKMTCLAKGVRKLTSKFCGRLELGYQIRFTAYAGRDFGYFKEVEVLEGAARFDLTFLGHAVLGAIAEVTLKLLQEGQDNEGVYNLLLESLSSLGEKGKEKEALKNYFQKLLTTLGFMRSHDPIQMTLNNLFNKPLKSEAVLGQMWSG